MAESKSHSLMAAEIERLRGLWAEAREGTGEALAELKHSRADTLAQLTLIREIDRLARQALEG